MQALKGVSIHVHAGEVVALAGDNGAGKSMMIKSISGVYHQDEGKILFDGKPIRSPPAQGARRGIETIYQDLSLADNLASVPTSSSGASRRRALRLPAGDRPQAHGEAAREDLRTSTSRSAWQARRAGRTLSGGQRQAVAIGRAIYWNAKLLIMDEPTAALGVPEQRKVVR